MTASYSVIVRNASQSASYFYIFQQLASFTVGGASVKDVTCSSLGCTQVGNYGDTGSQIEFTLDVQIYAGAIGAAQTVPTTHAWALLRSPRSSVLNMSTTSAACQPIALATQPNDTASRDFTTMSLNPLGLSRATNAAGVTAGSFGIQVPPYRPSPTPNLFCGNAVTLDNGNVVLSSFVPAPPNQILYCTPIDVYFIKIGQYAAGTPIDYDTSDSKCAKCDFTTGYQSIIVKYNTDGTFSIVSSS